MTQTSPPPTVDPSVTQAETPAPARPETPASAHAETAATPSDRSGEELVEADLLVEDVSIDGMCGVY